MLFEFTPFESSLIRCRFDWMFINNLKIVSTNHNIMRTRLTMQQADLYYI